MRRFVVILALLAACGKASSDGEAKQWAEPPPGKNIPIPPALSIAVTVDGVAKDAITAATLGKMKPDFVDEERKAWKIETLLGHGTVEATSPAGVSVKFVQPHPDGLEPVLFLTRRGEVVAAAVDPKDPFPKYHGQGGRLHRAGDQQPRLSPVSKLALSK